MRVDILPDRPGRRPTAPILLRCQHRHQVAPPRDERTQGLRRSIRQRAHGRTDGLGKMRQHRRIKRIGLR